MDINKITSYLLWNNPEKYEKISRLEFFEYVEKIYGYNLEKLNFFWEQANKYEEDFYKLTFEKFYSQSKKDELEKAKLERLLKELNLQDFLSSRKFDYVQLLQEFEAIIKTKTDINTSESQTKWKQFEDFLKKLFNAIDGFEVTEIKQVEDEQIDLVIKNNINKPFWLNLRTPVILWEAKNWSTKTPVKEIAILDSKLWGHNNFSRIGFFISMNWFTNVTGLKLERLWATEKIIVKITWDDIETLLKDELHPIDWIEWLVMKSFI